MKFKFGRKEPKDIDPATDYLMDNGFIVQLITTDPGKVKFRNWDVISHFKVSRKRFDSLLKRDLIHHTRTKSNIWYYTFRNSVEEFDEIL
jgi:hypothetical protein